MFMLSYDKDANLRTSIVGKRESSAKFDPSPPTPYSAENAQFAPLLKIECRGLEFVGFDPSVCRSADLLSSC